MILSANQVAQWAIVNVTDFDNEKMKELLFLAAKF